MSNNVIVNADNFELYTDKSVIVWALTRYVLIYQDGYISIARNRRIDKNGCI